LYQRVINRTITDVRERLPTVEEIDHLVRRLPADDSDGSSVTGSAAISITG
jgi:hypothetical protein